MSRMPSGPFGQSRTGFGRPTFIDQPGVGELSTVQFFNAVYAWMAAGLALTAVVAYWVATNVNPRSLNMGAIIILFVVEIGLVFAISSAINKISATVATGMFLLYAALNGITISGIFLHYTNASLASTFIVTAGAFGAMSLYGYTTGRDLTRWGSMLIMALIGLILAFVVNMFLHNSLLQMGISFIGVLIFVGLTAYDTQKLKYIAAQTARNGALAHRMAIVGSLSLYLDFINLFLMLLQLMGDRRN